MRNTVFLQAFFALGIASATPTFNHGQAAGGPANDDCAQALLVPFFVTSKLHQSTHTYFTASIPFNPALLGFEAQAQGLCTGIPGPRFSNALHVTLGF